jgi:hypothetical protein
MPNEHRRTLAQIQGDSRSTAGGAFAARKSFLADRLHRGCTLWLNFIEPMRREWAEYLGYPSLEAVPIATRELVNLYIADKLLVSLWEGSDYNGSVRELRAALNNLGRLAMHLTTMKREKSVPTLQDYLMQRSSVTQLEDEVTPTSQNSEKEKLNDEDQGQMSFLPGG